MEENLKLEIREKLRQIEQMIENGEERNKIDSERKKLDKMLEKYLNNI